MAATTREHTVLVIDDDPWIWRLADRVLAPEGYDVISAFDGLSGIERARTEHPVVILLDMIMPGLDGVGTCERLKRDPVLSDIPVVGITGSTDLTVTEKAFRAGAEFFVSKPFGKESLLEVVGMALEASAGVARASDCIRGFRPRFRSGASSVEAES